MPGGRAALQAKKLREAKRPPAYRCGAPGESLGTVANVELAGAQALIGDIGREEVGQGKG
jgi:hypothetical protein